MQELLARERPPPWQPAGPRLAVAGCAVVSARSASGPGGAGDPGFAGAVLLELHDRPPRVIAQACVAGRLPAGFASGMLALREGPLLAASIAALPRRPDVVLVHAAGLDHPRRAGLALMLGAVLDLPSFGVTARPLVARGGVPDDRAGARSPLAIRGEVVAYRVRTRAGARPVVAHAGWRTSPETAAALAVAACARFRTPEPLRLALERARLLRSGG
jgi:deoxyribonuclease V